ARIRTGASDEHRSTRRHRRDLCRHPPGRLPAEVRRNLCLAGENDEGLWPQDRSSKRRADSHVECANQKGTSTPARRLDSRKCCCDRHLRPASNRRVPERALEVHHCAICPPSSLRSVPLLQTMRLAPLDISETLRLECGIC